MIKEKRVSWNPALKRKKFQLSRIKTGYQKNYSAMKISSMRAQGISYSLTEGLEGPEIDDNWVLPWNMSRFLCCVKGNSYSKDSKAEET